MLLPGLLDTLLQGEELLADGHELVHVYFLFEDAGPELLEATDRIAHQLFCIVTTVLNSVKSSSVLVMSISSSTIPIFSIFWFRPKKTSLSPQESFMFLMDALKLLSFNLLGKCAI